MHLALALRPWAVVSFLAAGMTAIGQTDPADYYRPVTNGDGSRYPLEMSALVWRSLSDEIQAVPGSDGKVHVAYALMLTNITAAQVNLKSIDVVDPGKGDAITGANRVLTIKNEDITGMVRLIPSPTTFDLKNYTRQFGPGLTGIAYFSLTYASKADVPAAIAHRVQGSFSGREFAATSPPIRLSRREPVVVGPPLKGKGWMNGNGCCLEIGPHRFTVNPTNGNARLDQTFAMDIVQVNAENNFFQGDYKILKNWHFYGSEVIAAAAGTVVEAIRDLPDTEPGGAPPGITAATASGNRVIIDIGEGRYTMYAHMRPGSVKVKVGDYVRQGEKLGELGNSGNTTAPHLHFQVMDRPSSLDANSLPFVFDRFRLESRFQLNLEEIDAMDTKPTQVRLDRSGAGPQQRTMPLSRDVFSFEP